MVERKTTTTGRKRGVCFKCRDKLDKTSSSRERELNVAAASVSLSTPMPLPNPPRPVPLPFPLPEPPDDERAPVVVAFPPTPSEAAGVADAIERLPPGSLLSFARSSLISAHRHQADPIYATANLHAVFGAMLALCRALDAAAYPWDGADRRRARA